MRNAAQKAVELDPSNAEGHAAMAFSRMWLDYDWAGGQTEYRRALTLNPNEPFAYVAWAMHEIADGNFEETAKAYRKKLAIDPHSVMSIVMMGYPDMYAGRYDESLVWMRRAVDADPGFAQAHRDMAVLYRLKGMNREYVDATLKAAALSGASPERIAERLRAFQNGGNDAFDRNELEELLARKGRGEFVPATEIAGVYNSLGDKQKALDWLEKACDEHTFQVLWLKTFPGWKSLKGEARYQNILRRMYLAD